MSAELQILAAAVVLGFVHVTLAVVAATRVRGRMWNLSSREQEFPPLQGVAGRLDRASENFKETFPFFLAAVVLAHLLGRSNDWTIHGAQLYLLGRVIYLPVYAFGVIGWRTLIWSGATTGILLILVGALIA
jgi:uncharacterized MAPEG superfamily protein